jgi:hypothetical protein
MNRDQLWAKMKEYGVTQSQRMDTVPDADLKMVMQVCRLSAKSYVEFLLALANSGK